MSLWSRFKRVVRSIFGGAISSLENPKLILEENIRELNEQVPKMNDAIADVKADLKRLQKDEEKIRRRVEDLTTKIKASIRNGREDMAQQYAIHLESTRTQLEKVTGRLTYAKAAYDKALEIRKAFIREHKRKIYEARDAMRAHERAKWQEQIADAFEEFEVGGIQSTHGEMIERLEQETARREAKLEMALDTIDTQALQLEEEAEKYRATSLVEQIRLQMEQEENSGGMSSPPIPTPSVSSKDGPSQSRTFGPRTR